MRGFSAHWIATPILLLGMLTVAAPRAHADPDETVRSADQVLAEMMTTPDRAIPEALWADAQAVAIVPNVIKIGFVAGVRRGHGVVMVRDANGQWSLPQFVTLTGGSVGWQAGVQGTDVVLVFMTKKSVEGLLSGKFTIGADAAAAAGPVGRNAAAATDARLRAEILSYSRSRGLFVGLSLDGSAIEIDGTSQGIYYGTGAGTAPMRVPASAAKLHQDLVQMTGFRPMPAGTLTGEPTPVAPTPPPADDGAEQASVRAPLSAREALIKNATDLQATLDDGWKTYLALPAEVYEVDAAPPAEALRSAIRNYDRVAQDPKYRMLAQRREFVAAHQSLQKYAQEIGGAPRSRVVIPPPPQE